MVWGLFLVIEASQDRERLEDADALQRMMSVSEVAAPLLAQGTYNVVIDFCTRLGVGRPEGQVEID